jgi:Ser/Thr protein kinase RdoA (MazF antagonist)
MHVTRENEIHLFDFDFCGNGWLCLDIAFYIAQLVNIERYDAYMYEPKIKSFMAGYESITQLTPEEKRLLPLLGTSLYYFYLGIQCQRYENWSNTFLSENYLKRYIRGIVMKYYGLDSIPNE